MLWWLSYVGSGRVDWQEQSSRCSLSLFILTYHFRHCLERVYVCVCKWTDVGFCVEIFKRFLWDSCLRWGFVQPILQHRPQVSEPPLTGLPVVNTHKALMCPTHRSFKDPSVHGCFWQRGFVHDCLIPDKLGEKPQWLGLEDPSLPICPLTAAAPKLIKWPSYSKHLPLILSRWGDVCVFV